MGIGKTSISLFYACCSRYRRTHRAPLAEPPDVGAEPQVPFYSAPVAAVGLPAQNPSTTKPAKKAQNARSAKRPRPPRRRLGPARPQHLLRGRAERRARGRRPHLSVLWPRKLYPASLRPDRAAAALRGCRARGGTLLRPRHLWLVLRPDLAAAADDGALFKQLRPRWVRPGLHATATLLLPPEEGRARHVYCGERHVVEGDLGPHVPGPVPHGHLARDLVDW